MKRSNEWSMERWVVAVALSLLGLVSTGCKSPQPAWNPPEAASKPAPSVTLAPGDIIDVKFFYVPELNESEAVRPDGKIALQLIGEVEAQGKTPEALRDELYKLYTPQLKKPDVTVIVRSFQGRRVYVGGEVNEPGLQAMPGPVTALEAIMQAGGFNTRTAQVKNVVVIRQKDGQRYGASLDLRRSLGGKESPQFYLEPLDIVYVPRTRIARVGQWIDLHINGLIPVFGVAYTQPAGKGTVVIDTTRSRRSGDR